MKTRVVKGWADELAAHVDAAKVREGEKLWFASNVVQDDNGQTFIATVGNCEVNDVVPGALHYEETVYQVLGNTREECAANLELLMNALNASAHPSAQAVPVAWLITWNQPDWQGLLRCVSFDKCDPDEGDCIPLYEHPPTPVALQPPASSTTSKETPT